MKNKPCKQTNIDKIVNSDLFKILCEPVRIGIMRFLAVNGPSDIGTIAENFPQDRSVISRHLKMMLQSNIVTVEKKSRYSIYSFNGFEFLQKMETTVELIRSAMIENCEEYRAVLTKKK